MAITPVQNWNLGECEISKGLWVRQICADRIPSFEECRYFLTGNEIRELENHSHWLCSVFTRNGTAERLSSSDEDAQAAIKEITLGLDTIQVFCPIGTAGPILICRCSTDRTLRIEHGHFPQLGPPADWAGFAGIPTAIMTEGPEVFSKIRDAFQHNVIRLQTALQLLEQGLHARNEHLAIFLLTAGLNALTMNSNKKQFVEGLYVILGQDTLIFPPDRFLQRQPKYRVKDVAADLYELRSQVAHGNTIGQRFRETSGFVMMNGHALTPAHAKYQYRRTLNACAAFMLCSALRKILMTQELQTVAGNKSWRRVVENGL